METTDNNMKLTQPMELALQFLQKNVVTAWGGHGRFAMTMCRYLGPGPFVDLGVDTGFSTMCMAAASMCEGSSRKVLGVDTFRGDGHTGPRHVLPQVLSTWEATKRLLSGLADKTPPQTQKVDGEPQEGNQNQNQPQPQGETQDQPIGDPKDETKDETKDKPKDDPMELMVATFEEAANACARTWEQPAALVHIDGYHTHAAVSKDFSDWDRAPLTGEHTVFIFHDTMYFPDDVGRFFRELDMPRFEFLHTYGLGVACRNPLLLASVYELSAKLNLGPMGPVHTSPLPEASQPIAPQ